jgi:arylsulfatase
MAIPFKGENILDLRASVPNWESCEPPMAPEGTPNVVSTVLDDVGFSAIHWYRGPVETPSIDRIAADGIRSTQFHTSALCSPTRSCLLTGRHHTSTSMACVTEAARGFRNASATFRPSTADLPRSSAGEAGMPPSSARGTAVQPTR